MAPEPLEQPFSSLHLQNLVSPEPSLHIPAPSHNSNEPELLNCSSHLLCRILHQSPWSFAAIHTFLQNKIGRVVERLVEVACSLGSDLDFSELSECVSRASVKLHCSDTLQCFDTDWSWVKSYFSSTSC